MPPTSNSRRPQKTCLICLKKFTNANGGAHDPGQPSNHQGQCGQEHQLGFVLTPSSSEDVAGGGVTDADDAGAGPRDNVNVLYFRFLKFTTRYFHFRTLSEPLLEGVNELKNGGGGGELPEPFCDGCRSLVSYVCDLYGELQLIKLRLVWKLSELGRKLKVSKNVGRRLLKSVAEQLNVKTVKKLEMFRRTLEMRCIKEGSDCSPKPIIPRGLKPEMWKHSYSATKTALMNLIVVFLLASSGIYEKKEEPIPWEEEDPDDVPGTRLATRGSRSCKRRIKIKKERKSEDGEELSNIVVKKEYTEEGDDNYVANFGNDDNEPDSDWSRGAASPTSMASSGSEDKFNPGSTFRSHLQRKRKIGTGNKPKNSGNRSHAKKTNALKLKQNAKKARLNLFRMKSKSSFSTGHRYVTKGAFKETCTVCQQEFASRRVILEHLETTHETAEKLNQCWFCPKRFTVPQTLEIHRVGRHKKSIFRCEDLSCKQIFKTVEMYNEHLKGHLLLKPSGGNVENKLKEGEGNDLLPEQTYKDADTKEHLINKLSSEGNVVLNNSQNMESTDEEKDPPSQTDVGDEGQGHEMTKGTIGKCSKCNWGFLDPGLLELHEKSHVEIPSKGYIYCPKCVLYFRSFPSLQQHYNGCHTRFIDRPYECPECQRKMVSKKSLEIHVEQHNKRRGLGPAVCPHCCFRAKDQDLLEKHMKRHDPNNSVVCSVEGCGEKFITRSRLARHINRVHNDGKKHPCPICGVLKAEWSDVKSHMHAVHNSQTFVCDICGKGFRRDINLRNHRILHDPEQNVKRHICSECGMAYKTEVGLEYHVKSLHTPSSELRVRCPHCPKGYHRKFLFLAHLKTCMKISGSLAEGAVTISPNDQVPNHPRTPKRPGRLRKNMDEVEMTDNSSTSEEEEVAKDDATTMTDSNPEKEPAILTTAAQTLTSVNSFVADLTGIPRGQLTEIGTMTGATSGGSEAISVTNAQIPTASSSGTSGDSSHLFPTLDFMLMQRLLRQHPNPSLSGNLPPLQLGVNNVNNMSWLGADSPAQHHNHSSSSSFPFHPQFPPPVNQDLHHPNQSPEYSPSHNHVQTHPPGGPELHKPQNLHKQ